MFDNMHQTIPDEKHLVLVEKQTGKQRILPEALLVKRLGRDRLTMIMLGRDDYFDAYDYSYDVNSEHKFDI